MSEALHLCEICGENPGQTATPEGLACESCANELADSLDDQ